MKIINVNENISIPANFTGIFEWYKGTRIWYKEGKYHREDGPAIEFSAGRKYWYIEGKRHRLDGPAVEYSDGTSYWFIEGNSYSSEVLSKLINSSLFLGKEKGRYDLEWLRFLTEEKIQEFPIILGMKEYKDFKEIFEKLEGMENK
jgi:hypothetical protein